MATRRTFLIGLAASAVASEAAMAPAFAMDDSMKPMPGRLVFDSRFVQARAAAAHAQGRGLPTLAFAGEVAGLWYGALLPKLRENPVPFAGLTNAGALFCLERWAWDAGMRVVLRVDHVEGDAGGWRHVPAAAMPREVAAAFNPGPADFGLHSADLVLDGCAAWRDCTHAAAPRSGEARESGAEPLVTWVIAPARFAIHPNVHS